MPCQGAACDAHSVLVQREPAQDSHAGVKFLVFARAEPLIEVGSAAGTKPLACGDAQGRHGQGEHKLFPADGRKVQQGHVVFKNKATWILLAGLLAKPSQLVRN